MIGLVSDNAPDVWVGCILMAFGVLAIAVVLFKEWLDDRAAAAEPTEHTSEENVEFFRQLNREVKAEEADWAAWVGETARPPLARTEMPYSLRKVTRFPTQRPAVD